MAVETKILGMGLESIMASEPREKILKLIEERGDLPPLSDILVSLSAKIDDPHCELSEIAALIETEPVLAGKMIRLANSVFFAGGREQAKDLTTAVWRLGLKLILDLAYTLELPKMFYKCRGFVQRDFWRHSLAVAILSQNFGAQLIDDKKVREQCYVAGLMHDVGILVFFYLIPKMYQDFVKELDPEEKTLEFCETQKFGVSHSQMGALYIEKWWPVDRSVVEAVRSHHLEQLDCSTPNPSNIVWVSNRIANGVEITGGIQTCFDPIPYEVLNGWGFAEDGIERMVDEVNESLESTESLMDF